MDPNASSVPAVAVICCDRWIDMWNRVIPAAEVVAAECRVYFGRAPQFARPNATTGPQERQVVVDAIRERLPGVRYSVESRLVYQSDSSTSAMITLLWNVTVSAQGTRTGIDLLRHEGARITEVWSITGDLEMPVMRRAESSEASVERVVVHGGRCLWTPHQNHFRRLA